ncbi:MAG: hypothetical protein KAR38_09460, partial [Calditrichia bacterium]|nr:hypothetical protein [Calditrichia bacterium]
MQKKIIFFLITVFLFSSVFAQKLMLKKSNLSEKQEYSLINISNWKYWQDYDGTSRYYDYIAAGIYPKKTTRAIWDDGLVWGGYVLDNDPSKPSLRVGGQRYNSSTQPGWIKFPGNGIDPPVPVSQDNDSVHIYRTRRDIDIVHDDELRKDASDIFNLPLADITINHIEQLKDQYKNDSQKWPGNLGAPYYDLNNNGEWDPGIDEPGIAGADQTIWYTVNDLNDSLLNIWGLESIPIGLELQVTVWAYKYFTSGLGQTVFKRYRLINKSGFRIDSMFIGQFSDPDIGDYGDDLIGCDSILNYGFCYNGQLNDYDFDNFGLAPSAIGYVLLQGPVITSIGDTAIINFQELTNHKNLPMSSFWPYHWHHYEYNPESVYNVIFNGNYLVHGSGPFQGNITKFPVNGNPVTGEGDIDGQGLNLSMSDRALTMNTGPFSMEPEDVQEIVVAIGGANSGHNGDNIASVAKLQEQTQIIVDFYKNINDYDPIHFDTPEQLPTSNFFILNNNFPNPFNSITNIQFVLYDKMNIKLDIYNNMGQKIK